MVLYGKFLNNTGMGYSDDNPFTRERERLGDTIKQLRESKHMTQEDLADKASVNVSYLAKIENGYVNTTVRYLVKIARALRLQVRDLFEF
jgi:transcriptional regulator with XRE-family HTH domain